MKVGHPKKGMIMILPIWIAFAWFDWIWWSTKLATSNSCSALLAWRCVENTMVQPRVQQLFEVFVYDLIGLPQWHGGLQRERWIGSACSLLQLPIMTSETDVPCVPCCYDPPTLEKKIEFPIHHHQCFLFFSSNMNNVPISSSNQTWQWKTNHLVPWMSQ